MANRKRVNPDKIENVSTTSYIEPPKKRGCLFRIIKTMFILSVILGVIGVGIGIAVVKNFSKQLPEFDQMYSASSNTQVLDCKGRIITEFHAGENRRELVSFERLPKNLIHALLSIEDARFYSHYGVDPFRVVATLLKWVKAGRIRGGFSTITMQLARNAFLTLDQKVDRKIKEILLTFKIEKAFSKDEILKLYLNEINFGHGAWGIASAANIYFGKKVENLNLAECSTLAGVLNRPSYYDLFKNMEAARNRQKLVLKFMVRNGYISESQAAEAAIEPLILSTKPRNQGINSYFAEYVRQQLLEQNFSSSQIYTKGLKVHTTLDLDQQKLAETAFNEAKIFQDNPLAENPKLQGGLIVIEPSTGHIKAMVGGRDFKTSQFNRTSQALRQPGSSFKPYVYLTAIEQGITPNQIYVDEPLEIEDPQTKRVWKPRNYGNRYMGPITVKEGLMKSLNSVAVQLIQETGAPAVAKTAAALGITSKIPPYPSIALGAVDVKLIDMATAYGAIANLGRRVEPVAITKIFDAKNNNIYTNVFEGQDVANPAATYVLINLMKGVMESGTGRAANIDRPCAGKTGTTNDYVDAWFCGITPNLVCCLYVGNDDRVPLGPRASAGAVAAPIWKAFMEKSLAGTPVVDFRQPEGVVWKTICLDSGHLADEKCIRKADIPFIAGKEAVEICAAHNENGLAENEDGSILLTPTKVIRRTILSPTDSSIPESDDFRSPNNRRNEEEKPIFERRSKFQNRHDSPFNN